MYLKIQGVILLVDEVTRDFVPDAKTAEYRDSRLFPWFKDRLVIDSIKDDWVQKLLGNTLEKSCRCDELFPSNTNEGILRSS